MSWLCFLFCSSSQLVNFVAWGAEQNNSTKTTWIQWNKIWTVFFINIICNISEYCMLSCQTTKKILHTLLHSCFHKLNLGPPVTIAMDGMVRFIFPHSYNTIHSLTWLSSILPQNYPMVFSLTSHGQGVSAPATRTRMWLVETRRAPVMPCVGHNVWISLKEHAARPHRGRSHLTAIFEQRGE